MIEATHEVAGVPAPVNPRKAIGKSLRFSVFSRDGFACKYCGRQSDVVPLHVDHVTPVRQGGTNDIENLVTACRDCNLGKAGRSPAQAAPTESDRLRLAQERNEQAAAFEAVRQAMESRASIRQEVVNFWCDCTGRDSVDRQTLFVILSYVEELGIDLILEWIERASLRVSGDARMGRYISGCRRKAMEDMEDEG